VTTLSPNRGSRRIAAICGGTSSEREISLSSGKAIAKALNEAGWEADILDWPESAVVYRCNELKGYEVVFICYHGGAGENGRIQAVLDVAGIRYTGSGPLASALAMDKIQSKRLFEYSGIPTPKWFQWENREPPTAEHILDNADLDLPIVVKPASEGSTVGITIAKTENELASGIDAARKCGRRIFFEEYIPGREVTCAILDGVRLPVVEIVPEGGFYDYEHKYTKGASRYIVPAELEDDVSVKIIDIAMRAYNLLGLRHYARVDFRLNGFEPYCLEINSLPGMTSLSLVPMAAKALGIEFPELVDRIVRMALLNENRTSAKG